VSQFEVSLDLIEYVFRKAKQLGATTVLNPSPMRPFSRALIDVTDVIVLNEVELSQAAGLAGTAASPDAAAAAAVRWSELLCNKTVVVTLGALGLVAVDGGRVIRQPAPAVDRVIDTTGAGDCFCGALVAFLHQGYPLEDGLQSAQQAAAYSVQRPGASPSFPKLPELGLPPM
jgi:ribokinase